MKRELKNQVVDSLAQQIAESSFIYLADISTLNVETTGKLRRLCFNRKIQLQVVKNTLLKRAMLQSGKNFEELFPILNGPTSIMIAETGNAPAKLITDFRKSSRSIRPILKGAYIDEACFIGNDQLEVLAQLKSKEELVGDIIGLLQSPARNVISALQSGGQKISGILKTMSEKAE